MNDYFKQNQKGLLKLANSEIGREFLGIKDKAPIVKITSGSYHQLMDFVGDKPVIKATFFAGDIKIAKDLLPYFRREQEYQRLTDRQALFHYSQVYLNVTTFNPTSTAVSGGVGRGNVPQEAWTTIRSGAGNETEVTASVTHAIVSGGATDQWTYLRRVITLFDTSSLTADATITAGVNTWGLYVVSVADNFVQTIRMVTTTPASNTALVNADYAQAASSDVTQTTAEKTLASMTTSAYNDLTLNSTGDGNISKTGITKFGARYLSDINNTQPTWSASVNGNYVWQSEAGANPARLVVTYTLPAVGGDNYVYLI